MDVMINRSEGFDEVPCHPLDRLRPLRENFILRVNTFQHWTKTEVCTDTLCKNGFYYMGIDDKIQCVYCGGVISGVSAETDIFHQHTKHFGYCELVKRTVRHTNVKKSCQTYETYDARLASFNLWPNQLSQRPHDLAAAGLYYTGVGDACKCYKCGGILSEWESGDNPTQEHRRWFPQCQLSK